MLRLLPRRDLKLITTDSGRREIQHLEDLCESDRLRSEDMEIIRQILTQIQVADTGPGVPSELREKIFDPFFTTKVDGSGIGLNIAQRIVADHNGSISLVSNRWGGAEFRIEIPIERRMDAR